MTFHQLTVDNVLRHFSSTIEGLSGKEARTRLTRYGPNEIRREHEISPAKIFLSQFSSFIVYILIAAVFISFILHEHIDGAVIIAILIVNRFSVFFRNIGPRRLLSLLRRWLLFRPRLSGTAAR